MEYIPWVVMASGLILLFFYSVFHRSYLQSALNSSLTVDLVMRVILSLVVVGAALTVVLSSKYEVGTERWAFGVIGTVLGYWFRGK